MWFWPDNKMIELVSGCQYLNLGINLREGEDQSLFTVQAVPLFRYDWCKMSSRTRGGSHTPG
jgi:hypothetical protein